MTDAPVPAAPSDGISRIEIRRSARRRKTVSARMEGDVLVVLMPAGLSRSREAELVEQMRERVAGSRRRAARRSGDDDLEARAGELSTRYLGGRARPVSVRWVPPMRSRWASCSQDTGEIRVSTDLRQVPQYVLDYVLVHELAHLVVPGGHTPEFWAVTRAFPRIDRAMGYLEAVAHLRADGHLDDSLLGEAGADQAGSDQSGSDQAGSG